MNEGLKFNIGADITGLEKGIADSQKQLQQLSQSIKSATGETLVNATANFENLDKKISQTANEFKQINAPIAEVLSSISNLDNQAKDLPKTIGSIESELKQLGQTLKTATGSAIADTNAKIASLKAQLKSLKSDGLDGIKKPAADGAIALNSLGQVARDLPFGFIAIQNNLPQVFDSFGALSKQAGGTGAALKALGSTLIGPAGFAFAIGIVVSGVTELIQTYGSFGAAVDALFSKQSRFSDQIKKLGKEYQDYNKERRSSSDIFTQEIAGTDAQIIKVKALSSIILDVNKSYNERNTALNNLKSISKDFFGTLDLEKLKFSDLTIAVTAYSNSLKQAAVTQGFQQAISETSVQLAKQKGLLNQLQVALEDAKRAQPTFVGRADTRDESAIRAATDAFNNQNKIVQALERNLNAYKSNLEGSINAETRIKAPVDATNESFKKQQEAIKNAEKASKDFYYELERINGFISKDEKLTYQQRLANLQNYANTILNVKNSESDRSRALEQANKENNNFFESFKIGVTSLDVFKNALNSQAAVLQENIINQEAYNNSVKSLIPIFDVLAMRQEERNKQLKEQKALLTEFKAPTITAPQGLPTNLLSDDIVKATKEQQDAINKNISNYQAAYNIIKDTFFSPLEDLFSNFLSTGKFVFADFGKAILKAIQQIVAKIIATGIITLLANIFLPGIGAAGAAGGSAASGGLGKALLSGIGSALGFSLGGSIAAPQFAGVGGGTLGMSGSVNVVLRGSDLVGSINRTNATISRVG